MFSLSVTGLDAVAVEGVVYCEARSDSAAEVCPEYPEVVFGSSVLEFLPILIICKNSYFLQLAAILKTKGGQM
jgi:hypothetical protein